jgi:pimeloyl-ACP methyl ester carboxylesterase
MPKLQSNGITIAYESHGEGHPLLLICGVGYGGWAFRKLAPLLSDRYRVITFDNRGVGGSDKPEGPYSTPQMAQDAIGLLEGLGISSAYVLGHSLGGYIAEEIALARPDLVKKLVLASTTSGGKDVIPITAEALSVMTERRGDPLELINRGIAVATAPGWAKEHPDEVKELIDYRLSSPVPAAAYAAQVNAGAQHNAEGRVSAIKCPTLVLSGDADRVVPPGNAELLARKIPGAEVRIVRGAGHLLPIEAPEATASVLRAFLRA